MGRKVLWWFMLSSICSIAKRVEKNLVVGFFVMFQVELQLQRNALFILDMGELFAFVLSVAFFGCIGTFLFLHFFFYYLYKRVALHTSLPFTLSCRCERFLVKPGMTC